MTDPDNNDAPSEGVVDTLSPERRSAILDGAGRVFAQHGYGGASMAQIAREVGVSKGTLYNYFPSKAALFHGFVSTSCDHIFKNIFDIVPYNDEPADMLRRLGEAMMELLLSPSRQAIHTMVMAEAGHFPELAQAFFEAGPQRGLSHLSDWLRRETGAGRLAVPDPDFAAEQFLALCQTKVVMRARLRLMDATEADIRRIVDGAVWLFLKAYAAPQSRAQTDQGQAP